MESQNEDYSRHSPDKLLVGFTKGRMALWVVVAVVVHVVFIVVTSLGSIRDRWIDPEGAIVRKAAIEAARKAAATPPAKTVTKAASTNAAAASTNAAVASTNAATASTNTPPGGAVVTAAAADTNAPAHTNVTSVKGQDDIPEDRRNTPVVKRITEAAKPEDIPKQPDELGISLDETNRR
jgi:hypothetical protein